MITRTEDTSFDTDYDIFSLAGRTALIGGGLYAINKSVDQGIFKKKLGDTFKSRQNAHIQALKETIKNDIQTSKQERNTSDYAFKKNSFFNFPEEKANRFRPISLDQIADRLPSSYSKKYKQNQSSLMSELEDFHASLISKGESPAEYYVKYGDDNLINHIQIKTNAGKFDVHVVDNEGMITMGDNRYVSRNFYSHVGSDIKEVYGSDVGLVRFLKEHFGDIKKRKYSINEIRHQFQQGLYYSDKDFEGLLDARRANPLMVDSMRSSAIQDPYRKLTGKGLGINSESRFKLKQAMEGRALGSASDINKGILHLEDAPHYRIPFLDYTNNPKQLIRNMKYRTPSSPDTFMSDIQAIFLDKESMGFLKEELANRGVTLGELAQEELLINKEKAGTLINSNRSLSVDAKEVSDMSDYLLKQMSEVAGFKTPEEFSLAIKKNGFGSFDKNVQEKLKSISLNDYQNYLKAELAKSKKKSQAYLNVNKSIDHTSGDLETRMYYAEAERLKKEGKLDEALGAIDQEIQTRSQQLRDRNIFGKDLDGNIVKLEHTHDGLFIEDLHYGSGDKLTYRLRREKRLGVGDKIHDPSGELKALIKGEIDDMPGILEAVYKRKMGVDKVPQKIKDYFNKITYIAHGEALKTTVQPRTAFSVFKGIHDEAILNGNKKITDLLNPFLEKYESLDDTTRLSIWHQLDTLAKEQGTTLHGLSGFETGIGFTTSKLVAYGESAIDMGAGGLGFFSERHIKMFESMGMKNFVSDIMSRRLNKGISRGYADFKMARDLLEDTKYQGHFNLDDLSDRFIDNVFPEITKEEGSVFKFRNKYLDGKMQHGATFVHLGEEIEGINKIAIFNSEDLKGYIGHQIGSKSTYQKYSDLEQLTKNILNEARNRKDPEKLKTLVKNYKTAIGQMDDSLKKSMLGDKVLGSYMVKLLLLELD